jgi:hypothetical protein
MGLLFNPFFWSVICAITIVALGVAVVTGGIVYRVGQRVPSRAREGQGKRIPLALLVGATLGIATFYGLCNWIFTDPSIPRVRPSRESIIGQWAIDNFSRENMQRDGGYTLSTHTLTFHEDRTFDMVNMPDWWLSIGGASHGAFYSGSGTWEIDKFDGYWVIWMRFAVLRGYPNGLVTTLTIGDWNGERSIYYRLGESTPYLVSFKKQ